MVHVGGDNMSDQPEALGGGGARYACGDLIANRSGWRRLFKL